MCIVRTYRGVDRIATERRAYYLTGEEFSVNCVFAMAASVQFVPAETLTEFEFPQREAAFFYGLFLRGHSADQLRRDIEVPPAVLAKANRGQVSQNAGDSASLAAGVCQYEPLNSFDEPLVRALES